MGGPIVDSPLYVCRACKTTWLEDPQMYVEPERCPRCGQTAGEGEPDLKGENDVEIIG